ncbi:MAG: polysaccharide lyase [Myxococcota bacterium]
MRLIAFSLLLVAPSLVLAAPDDWAEGGSDAEDGATRDFYNRGARLRWQQLLGDWRDREGVLHGDASFASTRIADTDEERFVEWDVTTLVQAWVRGDVPSRGFFLRGRSGGPIDFSSREGAEAPQLVVNGATLRAVADTHLPASTFRDQGESDSLRVADESNTLVRFDLDGITDVESAVLRLYTTRQFGGGMDVDVFSAATGGEQAPRTDGLAAEFVDDEGIAAHPDVLMADGFESPDWMENWSRHGGDFVVTDEDQFGFTPLVGRALRARIPEGENTGLNTSYYFMEEVGEEPEEIYFRYYLRLGDDWNQSIQGGKLPGIAGTYNTAGWGGRRSDGTNGWSARGLFIETIPADANNPLAGFTPVGSYVYHADMEGTFGDNYVWTDRWGAGGHGGVFERDRWYCLEHYVRMNTPGETDGILRGWVDGRLSVERTAMRFRTVDSLRIERIWMNLFHGGTPVSPYDQHVFIDNVVIARSYVGPMGGRGGEDAGPGADAGGGDAGAEQDAGRRDAGVAPGADASIESTSGGGCSVAGSPTPVAFALALFALRRRR